MNNGKKTDPTESGDVIAVRTAEAVRVDVVVRDETHNRPKLADIISRYA
jgi:hypothetical protein